MRVIVYMSMMLTLAYGVVVAQQISTERPYDLYQSALFQERAVGDLDAAVDTYRQVVRMRVDDRELGSRALLGLGRCLQKQGSVEARSIYEQVIRDYPDQQEAVLLARDNLIELDLTPVGVVAGASSEAPPSPVLRRLPPIADAPEGTEHFSVIGGLFFGGELNVAEDTAMIFLVQESGDVDLALYDLGERTFTSFASRPYFAENALEFAIPYHAIWGHDESYWVVAEVWSDGTSQILKVLPDGSHTVIFKQMIRENSFLPMMPVGWLPDGGLVITDFLEGYTARIAVLDPGSDNLRVLTTFDTRGDGGDPGLPRLSPDGEFVTFEENGNIFTIDINGTVKHQLTEHPAADSQPLWSPDGSRIVFLSRRGISPGLWTMKIEEGRAVGGPEFVIPIFGRVSLGRWSERGLRYVSDLGADDVRSVPFDATTGEISGPAKIVDYAATGTNRRPVWSPGGDELAFLSKPAPNTEIVVLHGDGSAPSIYPIRIPGSRVYNLYTFNWLADASGFAFFVRDEANGLWLAELSRDSGAIELSTLSREPRLNSMEWKPDGSGFLYAATSTPGNNAAVTRMDIIEHDLASGRERVIWQTPGIGQVRGLDLSADGSRLLFSYFPFPGRRTLWTLDLQTKQLTDYKVEGNLASWSPDGRWIAFVSRQSLYVMPAGGGLPDRVDLGGLDAFGKPSWAPGGAYITVGSGFDRTESWRIEQLEEAIREAEAAAGRN